LYWLVKIASIFFADNNKSQLLIPTKWIITLIVQLFGGDIDLSCPNAMAKTLLRKQENVATTQRKMRQKCDNGKLCVKNGTRKEKNK